MMGVVADHEHSFRKYQENQKRSFLNSLLTSLHQ